MANVLICIYRFIPIQVSSKTNRIIMWTEEKLDKAATRYADNVEDNSFTSDEYCYSDVKNAFLAGARFIIKNTQK